MRRFPLALAMALTLGGNAYAVSVDYQKFSVEALMMMRPTVSVEDREPFRAAFLQKLEAMSPAERTAFQKKALAYLSRLDESERGELMKDLMSYMDSMTPEQLLTLSQQINSMPTPAKTESALVPTQAAVVPEVNIPRAYARPQRAMGYGYPPAYAYAQPSYSPPQAAPYRAPAPQQAYGYPVYGQPAYGGYAPAYGNGYGPGYGPYGGRGW